MSHQENRGKADHELRNDISRYLDKGLAKQPAGERYDATPHWYPSHSASGFEIAKRAISAANLATLEQTDSKGRRLAQHLLDLDQLALFGLAVGKGLSLNGVQIPLRHHQYLQKNYSYLLTNYPKQVNTAGSAASAEILLKSQHKWAGRISHQGNTGKADQELRNDISRYLDKGLAKQPAGESYDATPDWYPCHSASGFEIAKRAISAANLATLEQTDSKGRRLAQHLLDLDQLGLFDLAARKGLSLNGVQIPQRHHQHLLKNYSYLPTNYPVRSAQASELGVLSDTVSRSESESRSLGADGESMLGL